jgi:hydrogenase nickel incorporation protein HypA/HybF
VHELAVCQGLIDQVTRVAREQRAVRVHAVTVAVGALSGVEPGLLERAFSIARAGTVAQQARLHVETLPARVACGCGAESDVPPNRLLCPECGNWRVRVVGGEELMLTHVELTRTADAVGPSTMAG